MLPNQVTRSLLGYGVIAGPFYVTVSLAQAFTREGFDVTRHAWSLLSNGGLGWIQITNFVLTGLMVLAAAVGLHRAVPSSPWVGRLVGVYGASLVAAGALRADPGLGFPAGTPAGPGTVSWHGIGHFVAGGIGFLCVIAACMVMGRRFARDGRRGLAVYSRVSGALFLAGFVGIASGNSAPGFTLGFVAAVLVIWAWLATVSVHLYRATPPC
jgi:hypothetical membrane protein